MRFSTWLFPSLYSNAKIAGVAAFFAFAALAAFVAFHAAAEAKKQTLIRTEERRKALLALKLAGSEVWQWRREMACTGSDASCLKLQISFSQPKAAAAYTAKYALQKPCLICHSDKDSQGAAYFVTYNAIAMPSDNRAFEILAYCGIAAIACMSIGILIALRFYRAKRGICVVAFEMLSTADSSANDFLRAITADRRLAYYSEVNANRSRLATTPEAFARLLSLHGNFLNRMQSQLRFVAIGVDFNATSLLPIDILRGVFQLLKVAAPDKSLVHENLAAVRTLSFWNRVKDFLHIGRKQTPHPTSLIEKPENRRRLVFKNKSGALLKFIVWESEEARH